MLQTIEIGDFTRKDITGFRVSRRINGKLFSAQKLYTDKSLVGMNVGDIAQVVLYDIENEFAKGLNRALLQKSGERIRLYRLFNSFPTPEEVEDIMAVIIAAVDRLPRDPDEVTDAFEGDGFFTRPEAVEEKDDSWADEASLSVAPTRDRSNPYA